MFTVLSTRLSTKNMHSWFSSKVRKTCGKTYDVCRDDVVLTERFTVVGELAVGGRFSSSTEAVR